jgi:hypothetical protein
MSHANKRPRRQLFVDRIGGCQSCDYRHESVLNKSGEFGNWVWILEAVTLQHRGGDGQDGEYAGNARGSASRALRDI